MGLHEIREDMVRQWKGVDQRWDDARKIWLDDIATEFEGQVWGPLSNDVEAMLKRFQAFEEEISIALRATADLDQNS